MALAFAFALAFAVAVAMAMATAMKMVLKLAFVVLPEIAIRVAALARTVSLPTQPHDTCIAKCHFQK